MRFAMPHVLREPLLPLLRLRPRTLARLSTQGENGIKHDPAELHQHLELAAVEAGLQGLGIGKLMMGARSALADRPRCVYAAKESAMVEEIVRKAGREGY